MDRAKRPNRECGYQRFFKISPRTGHFRPSALYTHEGSAFHSGPTHATPAFPTDNSSRRHDGELLQCVLTRLFFDGQGNVSSRNVGVTFSLHDAEAHRAGGVQNEFEEFLVSDDWREDTVTTALVKAMRSFRGMVEEMQEAALR